MNMTQLIGRDFGLYDEDLNELKATLDSVVHNSTFLVVGGAGTIGQAAVIELFSRSPRLLHVIDISENNLVELVRRVRSSFGYFNGEFKTFCIDCGSKEFQAFCELNIGYDYVLNLSALKHVRSEKDQFTLMRMINTNIFNTYDIVNAKMFANAKHFCVSTDKAANPVNMMGASKKIMEQFLFSSEHDVSLARFANVAFSDGSLLHGFQQRFLNKQPITAPKDVKRYFVTQQEAGQLCVLSTIFGEKRDIFVPKMIDSLELTTFSSIAIKFLAANGFEVDYCDTEEEARAKAASGFDQKWPCYFFQSDTTGEKPFEEFFTQSELIDGEKFKSIDVVKNTLVGNAKELMEFRRAVQNLLASSSWTKAELVAQFNQLLPEFAHKELGKDLDQRM